MTNKTPEKEGLFIASAMYLPRKLSEGYTYVSSDEGAPKFLKPILLVFLASLSVESIFKVMPKAYGLVGIEVPTENRSFVPKPFVNDGADITLLSPLPNLQRAAIKLLPLPQFIETRLASDKRTVWDNSWEFALAIFVALSIQNIEAQILRKKSVKEAKAGFDKYNNIQKISASPEAVALAHLKAASYNQYGSANTTIRFSMMLMLYILEGAAFVGSFTKAHWVITYLYGFLTIFGYEVFSRMYDDD